MSFPGIAGLALGTPGLVFFGQLARDDGVAPTPTPRSGGGYRSGSDPRVSLKGHARGGVEWRARATSHHSPPTTLGRVRSFQTEVEPTGASAETSVGFRRLPCRTGPARKVLRTSYRRVVFGRLPNFFCRRAPMEGFRTPRRRSRRAPSGSAGSAWFRLVSVDFGFTAMTQGFGSNLCRSSHFQSIPRS